MRRPLFWSIVVFITGICLSLYFVYHNLQVRVGFLIVAELVLLILIVGLYIYGYRQRRKLPVLLMNIVAIIALFLAGLIYGFVDLRDQQSKNIAQSAVVYEDREIVTMTGIVTDVWYGHNYQTIMLKQDSGEKIQIRIWEDRPFGEHAENSDEQYDRQRNYLRRDWHADVMPGQTISVTGEYRTLREKRNPGGFDEQRYFWINDWSGKLFISKESLHVTGTSDKLSDKISRHIFQIKTYFQEILASSMEQQEFAVVNALLLGDRSYIDYEMNDQIKKLGLAHVFAISGLHIGVIIMSVLFVADKLMIMRERTYIFILVALPLYGILTGAAPSIMRAVIMGEIVVLANLLHKRSDIFTNLSLAALIILLINPKAAMDVGFQMTFLITLGIVIFMPIINYGLQVCRLRWLWLRTLLSLNLSAQILAFPLLIYYFQEFPWTSLLSHYLVLPLINLLLLPAGIFLLLTAWIHPALAVFPVMILQQSAKYLLIITEKISFAMEYVTYFPEVSFGWITCYFILIAVLAYYLYYKRHCLKAIACIAVILAGVIGWLWMPSIPDGKLHVTMIDVGQGDAIHIATPRGKHILIDGGGMPEYFDSSYDTGMQIVVPYLYAKRVRQLDMVFVSHGDNDHAQGLISLLGSYPVSGLFYSVDDQRQTFQQLMTTAADRSVSIFRVGAGDRVDVEPGLTLEIFLPDLHAPLTDANNDSMVIALNFKGHRLLFTGDIEQEAERRLTELIGDQPVSVLKVAHHGSKTSTDRQFVEKIQPQHALISAGYKNQFGHPHETTLETLQSINCSVWRTDLQGAVTLTVSDDGIIVSTMILE